MPPRSPRVAIAEVVVMADKTRRVDYFKVEVSDQPGAAAPVLQKLKDAKVNLLAFVAFPIGNGKSQLDFVPENADAFTKAFKGAGLTVSERKQAVFIQGQDRVGAVTDIHARLAEAKINVRAASACAASAGSFGMIVWVPQEKLDAAVKALGA